MKVLSKGIKIIKLLLYDIVIYFRNAFYDNEYIAIHQNVRLAKKIGVKVGHNCRFFSVNFSTEPYLIEIGNHVTITGGVQLITHDGGVWVFREENPNIELFGKIKIGNNVFIGLNSIILLNTEIGDNCIVAAGSVVKGKFEENSVIAGMPAKRILSIEEYFEKNKKKFSYVRSEQGKENKIKAMMKSDSNNASW